MQFGQGRSSGSAPVPTTPRHSYLASTVTTGRRAITQERSGEGQPEVTPDGAVYLTRASRARTARVTNRTAAPFAGLAARAAAATLISEHAAAADRFAEVVRRYGRSTANSLPHSLHRYQSCASSYARICVSQTSDSLRHRGHRLGWLKTVRCVLSWGASVIPDIAVHLFKPWFTVKCPSIELQ